MALRLNPVNFNFIIKGLPANPQALGRFKFVSVGILEHLDDGVALHGFHEGQILIFLVAHDRGDGEVPRIDHIALAHQHRALDLVLQLAHIAGPVEGSDGIGSRRGKTGDVSARLRIKSL